VRSPASPAGDGGWQFKGIDVSLLLNFTDSVARRRPVCRGKGFTLLELLVVVAIIGVLISYVGPKYFGQVGKTQVQAAKGQLDAFSKAIDAYRLDVGRPPTNEEGLRALVSAPPGAVKWQGPYLQDAVPADPWGQPYEYKAPGSAGRDYDLTSRGRDGRSGGSGEDADIVLSR
jgi:general secretion pathway protein G